MKKNCFVLAALAFASAMMLTSCSQESNSVVPAAPLVISFEQQTLNEDGYWYGDATGTPFDNWGSTSYSCLYTESGVTMVANYTPAWGSWSGFGISSRTETTFSSASLVTDQFNNCAGGAHTGKNFCVVYPYGESIVLPKPATVSGFYFTNDAWTADAILNGDGMTPGKFEAADWLKCIVTGTHADETTASVEIWLAKDGDYVKDWQWADLSSLGQVTAISFSFDGTKKNDWGLTTPTYICIDDLTIQVD